MVIPFEILPITVPCERPGSGTVNFGKSGVAATRKWVVPWEDIDGLSYWLRFVQLLLGQTIAGPGGMPIVTYPDVFSQELPWLFCQEVDMEPEDCIGLDIFGRIRYRRAVLTAKYMPYEVGESFNLSAQALTLLESTYSFLGTLLSLNPPPAFQGEESTIPFVPVEVTPGYLEDYLAWLQQTQALLINPGIGDDFYSGANETWTLTCLSFVPTQGEFQINVNVPDGSSVDVAPGQYNCGPIQFDDGAEEVQAALVAGLNGDETLITCTGGPLPDFPVLIQFNRSLATRAIVLEIVNDTTGDDDLVHESVMMTFQSQIGRPRAAGDTVGQPLTKIIPLGEYSLERHQMLAPNFWTLICLLGTINGTQFLGFPPWTLLFSGIDGKKTVLPNGTRCWDLSFKFHFNPNSWNMVYRPDKGRWEVLAAKGTSVQTYWCINQAAPGQQAAFNNMQSDIHPWLYRPSDFSPIILFS